MTLLEVLRRATGYLADHGSGSARLDAEVLLAHALNLRRLDLYLQFERPMADEELSPYRQLIARRARGEPVAYLVGHKEFMGLEFEVTPDVLVPNPDTELLVQRAVEIGRRTGGAIRAADVGTGSGCVAIALAHFLPGATVFASDVSQPALAVAVRNRARHALDDRVQLLAGDLLVPLPAGLDLVCANLPYLAEEAGLPPEVTAQPGRALYGGRTGAELVLRLLEQAPRHLAPAGTLLAEIEESILEVTSRAAGSLFSEWRVLTDLGGHPRVLEASSPRSG